MDLKKEEKMVHKTEWVDNKDRMQSFKFYNKSNGEFELHLPSGKIEKGNADQIKKYYNFLVDSFKNQNRKQYYIRFIDREKRLIAYKIVKDYLDVKRLYDEYRLQNKVVDIYVVVPTELYAQFVANNKLKDIHLIMEQ